MKRALGCALLALALGCGGGAARFELHAGDANPWTHLAADDAPDDFAFAIVADRTGGHRAGVFEDAIAKLGLLRPAFVMSVGDLIEGYTEDTERLDAEWREFDGFVEALDAPFFYAAGNHDYSNPVMARDWARRFGRSYYHFVYRDVLFLVLNSEIISSVARPGDPIAGPDTAEAQERYVERVLARHADARWTLVFVHQPLWDTARPAPAWLRIEALLGERPYTVFAGHYHRYTLHRRHDRRYLTLATTGGVSGMRGVLRGEFDHVAWVTMKADGPRIANLMLDGIHGDDVRTEGTRELVRRLDEAVEPLPLWVEGDVFDGGLQRFALRNASDRPIVVRGRFDASPHLAPQPVSIERTLAPGESETVAVELAPRGLVDLRVLVPGAAHWSASAEGDAGPVEVEHAAWLLPDRRFPVRRAARAVTVDADLAEWGPLRFALDERPADDAEAPAGAAPASLRFDLRHDDDFLYFAFAVDDPTPFFSPERTAREQDGVALTLDARPEELRSRNEGFIGALRSGTLASLLSVWLAPVEPAPDPDLEEFLPPPPDGVLRAARRSASGYTAELAVPRAFLDERAGGAWDGFRLNLTLQDFDADGGASRHVSWRPDRFGIGGLGVPGAGTFVRD